MNETSSETTYELRVSFTSSTHPAFTGSGHKLSPRIGSLFATVFEFDLACFLPVASLSLEDYIGEGDANVNMMVNFWPLERTFLTITWFQIIIIYQLK